MDYSERFTKRVCFKEDEIGESTSYTTKFRDDVLTERLGLYEDLGFSPGEIADLLLDSDALNADEMERMKLVKLRAEAFDNRHYYT
ncbi:MAG: hypothetical protein IJI67_10065 [Clostridia bacterium]|nr:hypothetical protein [Clostridia bacterium]